VFRNDIEDKILRVDTGEFEDGLPIVSYQNTSEAFSQGAELSLKAIIAKSLSGFLSYTYTDTEDKETGNALTYIPENHVVCGLVYDHKGLGLTAGINFSYSGEMYTDEENTEETDAYSLVDVKLAKRFGEIYTVSVEGNNIFDSDYGQPDREWLGATYLVRFKMDF
jgi:outer membrane receptor for ferrienterochelin and colicins